MCMYCTCARIADTFAGMLRHELRCTRCSKTCPASYEPFWSVPLAVPKVRLACRPETPIPFHTLTCTVLPRVLPIVRTRTYSEGTYFSALSSNSFTRNSNGHLCLPGPAPAPTRQDTPRSSKVHILCTHTHTYLNMLIRTRDF